MPPHKPPPEKTEAELWTILVDFFAREVIEHAVQHLAPSDDNQAIYHAVRERLDSINLAADVRECCRRHLGVS